jgi:hypothetical protein
MHVQRNTDARSCNHCCRWEAIRFIEYECVFEYLYNQYAKRMRRFVFLSVACLAYHIFPFHLTNGKFLEKTLLNMRCVFGFSVQVLSEIFLILRIIQRSIIVY